jgi:hypothetical protein
VSATIFSASMSSPESVSSSTANLGDSIAICSISLRFRSPPEKPTLTFRFSISSGMFSTFIRARAVLRNCIASRSLSPLARRTAFSAVRRKLALPTPGSSTGPWKARNMPATARSSGSIASRSWPSRVADPSVTS